MFKATKEWREDYYRKRVAFYKWCLGGVCIKCGTTHNLQFDHISPDTKIFCITAKYDASWEIMKPELDKCQLLCIDCHIEKGQTEGDVKAAATHGSLGMYRHQKCRCDDCRKTWNEYHKNWKRQRRIILSGKGPAL